MLTILCCIDYCNSLVDGKYYDPWNPWCGYVECSDGHSVRLTCPQGHWMGVSDGSMTQLDMCRRGLPLHTSCTETTMQRDLCRMAEAVSSMTSQVDTARQLQV